VLFYNIINYSIFSYSLYDENYAISLGKQSTCGEKYRDILRNIAIYRKIRYFFDDSIRYIDIEFDIIATGISIYRVITTLCHFLWSGDFRHLYHSLCLWSCRRVCFIRREKSVMSTGKFTTRSTSVHKTR